MLQVIKIIKTACRGRSFAYKMEDNLESFETESSDNDNPDDEPILRRSKRIAKHYGKTVAEDNAVNQLIASNDDHPSTPSRALSTVPRRVTSQALISKAPSKRKKGKNKRTSESEDENEGTKKKQRKDTVNTMEKKQHKPSAKRSVNKEEKDKIIKTIYSLELSVVSETIQFQLQKEKSAPKTIVDSLVADTNLFQALVEYHIQTFGKLYKQNSKGKEKYLKFQIDWHTQCSVFLLPQESSIKYVLTEPSKEVDSIRQRWLIFCQGYADFSDCCKVMINLSSLLYTMLLGLVHSHNKKETQEIDDRKGCDSDDVYMRFGGAVLSDMHHSRYKAIRTCEPDKREVISLEIDILHAINTKEKSTLPLYIKYRDRGYMYTPHLEFIPFIRDVDECVKEMINEKQLLALGDQIVKVHIQHTYIVHVLPKFVGSTFASPEKKYTEESIFFHCKRANARA